MRATKAFAVSLASIVAVGSWASAEDPSADYLYDEIVSMRSAYEDVISYTATFYKQERVGNKLLDEERIELKFQRPHKVYMRWVGKAHKGREALYVRGENEDYHF